ncbi:MAG: DUF309 domain-containing protein [Planctomycetes bacterium]|nr:DUF309 domain-containing protein [Planctomycetota bacterium]
MGQVLGEPSPSDPSFEIYCPYKSFPNYRYVPGLNPHPKRDQNGHSYGITEVKPTYYPPDQWRKNITYLFGIDLFNYAYWWECHEVIEGLWHLVEPGSVEGQFLQAIIQLAAANLNKHRGLVSGANMLARESCQRLEFVSNSTQHLKSIFMGVDVSELLVQAKRYHNLENIVSISYKPPLIRLAGL